MFSIYSLILGDQTISNGRDVSSRVKQKTNIIFFKIYLKIYEVGKISVYSENVFIRQPLARRKWLFSFPFQSQQLLFELFWLFLY